MMSNPTSNPLAGPCPRPGHVKKLVTNIELGRSVGPYRPEQEAGYPSGSLRSSGVQGVQEFDLASSAPSIRALAAK